MKKTRFGASQDRASFYPTWAKFHEVAADHERVHAERLNVIKEACGNGAVSLGCGVAFFGVGHQLRGQAFPQIGPLLTLSAVLFVCLWRMHVIHVERYGLFLQSTIAFRKELARSWSSKRRRKTASS